LCAPLRSLEGLSGLVTIDKIKRRSDIKKIPVSNSRLESGFTTGRIIVFR